MIQVMIATMDALCLITCLTLLTQVNSLLISQASSQQLEQSQVNITQLLFIRFRHLFAAQDNETTPLVGNIEALQQSTLELRKLDQLDQLLRPNNFKSDSRKYFKILNRVFSRVELPEVYKATNRMRGSSHCGLHIGCVEEIPNFASLLRKTNVSSSYTLYSRENPKIGHKINYEPIVHHQLEDSFANEAEIQEKVRSSSKPRQVSTITWLKGLNIARSQEYPFDLASLELSGFNASLNTRLIVGGYFAKEDEEWIDEVVRQWLLLEPCNIIKVSWADANRGLYHSAAYNSRIVGRQLTLFLYYLNQLFQIDLARFHLVGHSLGAHIAGFVGADNEGRIARITGLDPAGPIFVELNASMRLDPTDAKFVDVLHTNGGSITKGALGLSSPAGHVDYYCNGGSLQPGCYFSSVTKSIMDPVERVACSHRRSYRYFIEIIKLTIAESAGLDLADTPPSSVEARNAEQEPAKLIASRLPRAFLFEAKQEELVRLTQPEIVLMSGTLRRDGGGGGEFAAPPLKRPLEFHLLNPEFPPNKRGMYFFRTRSESPFFASKQYALTLRTESTVRRKMALMAKLDQTLVAEVELDEIPGIYTLAFAPNDPRILNLTDESRPTPQLSLMWRHRSFNLLLNQQNELHINSLELSLLDSDSDEQPVIRYTTTTGNQLGFLSKNSGSASDMTLTRNQWYKFEGRVAKSTST